MARLHRSTSGICAVLLWCCMATASADDAGGPDSDWRPTVLELRVNGVVSGQDVVALRDAGGGLWLAESDFVRLRLRLPAATAHVADGKRYFPVAGIAGAKVVFDEARSAANINAPAAAFLSSSLALLGLSRPPMS